MGTHSSSSTPLACDSRWSAPPSTCLYPLCSSHVFCSSSASGCCGSQVVVWLDGNAARMADVCLLLRRIGLLRAMLAGHPACSLGGAPLSNTAAERDGFGIMRCSSLAAPARRTLGAVRPLLNSPRGLYYQTL